LIELFCRKKDEVANNVRDEVRVCGGSLKSKG
jgi:hypothetical protein